MFDMINDYWLVLTGAHQEYVVKLNKILICEAANYLSKSDILILVNTPEAAFLFALALYYSKYVHNTLQSVVVWCREVNNATKDKNKCIVVYCNPKVLRTITTL